MTNVTRYFWGTSGMVQDNHGWYVRHEDYVTLEKELKEVKELLDQRDSELSSLAYVGPTGDPYV